MATYRAETNDVLFTLIQTNGEYTSGWTVPIPMHWTIAQIERYLGELRSWA